MSDFIRREDVVKAMNEALAVGDISRIIANDILNDIPSAEPDNQVHLCDSCHYCYPVCPAEGSDVIFGNGIGHDNVCSCAKFEIKPERTAKVYQKQAPDKLYYFYCGACGEMIDCSFHEDYKSIKSYCGYCGAKLDWGDDE